MTPAERRALYVILTVTSLAPRITATDAQGAVDGQVLEERRDQRPV